MGDLKNPLFIHLKGWLFLAILLSSFAIMVVEHPRLRTVVLLCLIVWSAARFYYYLFYVIEHYLDAGYKFSGLYSALKYFLSRKK